jgi:crotonobetainyl-CoA:carnitine CoA-transferase CaiB-like acyl-CoA transferase
MSTSHPPLRGVRVLDLSRILAGPWATQLLADYGAEVIKVERPGSGDDTRRWGPPFVEKADGTAGDAAYFQAANRNKQSVTIDFTTPDGAALIKQLAAKSDILVENYKLGGLQKYGLHYEALAEVNPKLVYCSITGFGQYGPYAERPGYDFLIQAMGGMMSITGQPDGVEGAEPMRAGVAIADLFTGLYATTGIMAALHHAQATGEGQHIDISLLDSQMAVLANQAMNYLVSGEAPGRIGNTHPNIVPYQVFRTQNGHFILAVGNDAQFEKFCAIAQLEELARDDRFATNAKRVENREALVALLVPVLAARTTEDWIETLEEAGVPCGPIRTIDQVLTDEHAAARDMVVRLPDAEGQPRALVGNPVKFSETPVAYHRAPPALGQSTEEVLSNLLALDANAIQALKDKNVI